MFKIFISDLDKIFKYSYDNRLEVLPSVLDVVKESKRAWQLELWATTDNMKLI